MEGISTLVGKSVVLGEGGKTPEAIAESGTAPGHIVALLH